MGAFNWTPKIGDPTVGGWVTVALYFVTAANCWMTLRALQGQHGSTDGDVNVWRLTAFLFAALGINKQLDLQTALTELGRVLARQQGWYAQRQEVQVAFIITVGLLCVVATIAMIVWSWDAPAAAWMGILGSVMVLGFVAVRAASFHHFDRFIGMQLAGLRWNWILEISGILVVLVASRWRLRAIMAHGIRKYQGD